MLASSILRAANVSVLISAISMPGTLRVSIFAISTLPGPPPANAIFGVAVASGSLTGVGRTAASSDDEGVSLIIARLPMEDPQCGGELDPMAVTNRLPFRGLPLRRQSMAGRRAGLRLPRSSSTKRQCPRS